MSKSKIFVSIASYKDPELEKTIVDCFKRATQPSRIYIGVFIQDDDVAIDRLKSLFYNDHVRILSCSPEESNGCGWARNEILNKLYDKEDYFLQIDSHSRFKKNWDTEYILLQNSAPSKSVISCFPKHYDLGESYEDYSIRDMPCVYIPNEIPYVGNFVSPHKQRDPKGVYEKIMNISGGNLFGPGSIVDVLKLPEYLYVGTAEQELYSYLLYSCGYDIYAVSKNLIWHKYFTIGRDDYRELFRDKKKRIKFWPHAKTLGCGERSAEDWVKDYNEFCKSLP